MFEKTDDPEILGIKIYLYTFDRPCMPLLLHFLSIAHSRFLPWSTFMIQYACYNASLVHLVPPTACSVRGSIATGLE